MFHFFLLLRDDIVEEKRAVFKSIYGHSPVKTGVFVPKKVKKQAKKEKASAMMKEPSRKSSRRRAEVNYCETDIKVGKKKTRVVPEKENVRPSEPADVMNTDQDSSENSQFVCSDCNKSFKFNNSLNKHIKAEHMQIEFKCNTCNKSFNYKANLKRHNDLAHNEFAVRYKCSHCLKLFMYSCTLKKHLLNTHNVV